MWSYVLGQFQGVSTVAVPSISLIWLCLLVTERRRFPSKTELAEDFREFLQMNVVAGIFFMVEAFATLLLFITIAGWNY